MKNCELLLLAAGFGTRLRPLTDSLPKPLIKVGGKTLIERHLELAAAAGFSRVFINLHHLGDQIRQFVGDGSRWGLSVEYSAEDPILDTGGAIKQIEHRLQEDLLITVNSDIIVGPDCDLRRFAAAQIENPQKPAATMVVRRDPEVKTYGAIGVLPGGEVASFVGSKFLRGQPGEPVEDHIYTGIQVLTRRVFDYMPAAGIPFGITRQTYPLMLQAGERIWSVRFDGYWNDVGTPERLNRASNEITAIFPVP